MTINHKTLRCLLLMSLLALLLLPAVDSSRAAMESIHETQRLAPASLDYIDHFGYTLAMDGNLLLVPAEFHEPGGAVYVFERDWWGQWLESTVLLPDYPVQYGSFGCSIALRGSTAFIGANNYPNGDKLGAGSVFVFERKADGSWTKKDMILPDDAQAFDNFGMSLALDGGTLAVGGIHTTDYGQTSRGAVYIFREDENGIWQQERKLLAADPQVDDKFGTTLALSGSTLLVGDAGREQYAVEEAGTVYVFERNGTGTWSQTAELSPAEPISHAYFGLSMALRGDRAVIGAPLQASSGAAYVYTRGMDGKWNLSQELLPDEPEFMMDFGWAIALNEAEIYVSSPGITTVHQYQIGRLGSWVEANRFEPLDQTNSGYMGRSIAISEDQVSAGQFPMSSGFGSVYVFDLPNSSFKGYHSFIPVILHYE